MPWNKVCALIFVLVAPLVVAQQTLKVDVNLVNVFITAQDENGTFITDLARQDFKVYEDDEPKDIAIFEKQGDVQTVLSVLMDISGSMVDILPHMNRGVRDFAKSITFPDEYSVITFGTGVRLIHRTPQTPQHLEQALNSLRTSGTSVLFDAMLYGMDRVNASDNERKALIVFTDGIDNGSTTSYGRISREAQLSGIVCYFVAIGSPVLVDKYTVESLSKTTGGRTFYVPKAEAVTPYLDRIRTELSKQYYLGYYAPKRPGYHRIRVEVPSRKNIQIYTRPGYLGS